MGFPQVASRAEWLSARRALRAKEKEATRARDALNGERRRMPMVAIAGTGYYVAEEQPIERPGLGCFLRDGDRVFHTYSLYGRGGEATGGPYYDLDLTALGRQEDWEEPEGSSARARPAVPVFEA
jgi:predicted dithiol-disulfide oxidoreductase (DUF899 family)